MPNQRSWQRIHVLSRSLFSLALKSCIYRQCSGGTAKFVYSAVVVCSAGSAMPSGDIAGVVSAWFPPTSRGIALDAAFVVLKTGSGRGGVYEWGMPSRAVYRCRRRI